MTSFRAFKLCLTVAGCVAVLGIGSAALAQNSCLDILTSTAPSPPPMRLSDARVEASVRMIGWALSHFDTYTDSLVEGLKYAVSSEIPINPAAGLKTVKGLQLSNGLVFSLKGLSREDWVQVRERWHSLLKEHEVRSVRRSEAKGESRTVHGFRDRFDFSLTQWVRGSTDWIVDQQEFVGLIATTESLMLVSFRPSDKRFKIHASEPVLISGQFEPTWYSIEGRRFGFVGGDDGLWGFEIDLKKRKFLSRSQLHPRWSSGRAVVESVMESVEESKGITRHFLAFTGQGDNDDPYFYVAELKLNVSRPGLRAVIKSKGYDVVNHEAFPVWAGPSRSRVALKATYWGALNVAPITKNKKGKVDVTVLDALVSIPGKGDGNFRTTPAPLELQDRTVVAIGDENGQMNLIQVSHQNRVPKFLSSYKLPKPIKSEALWYQRLGVNFLIFGADDGNVHLMRLNENRMALEPVAQVHIGIRHRGKPMIFSHENRHFVAIGSEDYGVNVIELLTESMALVPEYLFHTGADVRGEVRWLEMGTQKFITFGNGREWTFAPFGFEVLGNR